MAYIFGFLIADGNLIHTKRDTWFWSLQINDKDILEKIKTAVSSTHVISKRKRSGKWKTSYRLQIGSKEMCEDLLRLGMTERKSKTVLLPKIPDKFLSNFIRGYFDGDGGVWAGCKNKGRTFTLSAYFTSGSEKFLATLKDRLMRMGIAGGSLIKKKGGFDLKYSTGDSLILYKIMYNSRCSLFLERKKEKFEKYIKIRGRSSAG